MGKIERLLSRFWLWRIFRLYGLREACYEARWIFRR
jgi:hypothetical protein